MPLDKSLLKACPLFTEGDILSLSADYRLDSLSLVDQPLQAVHELTARGSVVVKLLLEAPTYQALTAAAVRHNIDETALRELLGLLNQIGGLRRKRTWQIRLIAIRSYCLHLAIGIFYAPVSYRRPVSLITVSVGTLRAITPVILATGVVAGLLQAAGFASLHTACLTTFCLLMVFYLSITFHELTHCIVLRRNRIDCRVLQSGMHVGIIHRKPGANVEIISSLAGPVVGMLLCLLAGGLSWTLGAQSVGCLIAAVALLHGLSLAPFYGDGISLKKALLERKTSETHP